MIDFSRKVAIFATANIADLGATFILALYDRLTSFDLVKSGKFINRSQIVFSQVSHVPSEGHGLLFYHLLTSGSFQNLTRQV